MRMLVTNLSRETSKTASSTAVCRKYLTLNNISMILNLLVTVACPHLTDLLAMKVAGSRVLTIGASLRTPLGSQSNPCNHLGKRSAAGETITKQMRSVIRKVGHIRAWPTRAASMDVVVLTATMRCTARSFSSSNSKLKL